MQASLNFSSALTVSAATGTSGATVPREIIRFEGVSTRFGEQQIHEQISLSILAGEFVCILGPSGCGKSTVLRLIGGLLRPDGGRVTVAGGSPDDNWARLAYVFQSPRLAPWRTALENVALAMELRSPGDRGSMRERAKELLALVGLQDAAHRYPSTLSGGERQRVAIARALAVDPDVILMDEPFSSLDPNTRTLLRKQILDLWSKTGKTVVFVTHDIDEAIELADRIILLTRKPTRIERSLALEAPRPRDIRRDPVLTACQDELRSSFAAMGAAEEIDQ